MRHVLFWFLVVVLIGGTVSVGVFLAQPRVTIYHPDYGSDCDELLTRSTENAVDCVRVFYGTNRKVIVDGAPPAGDAETDAADVRAEDARRLHVGRADVWLPKLIEDGGSRERGETPFLKGEPPEKDQELAKYVFLTRITTSGRERFILDLDDALIDQDSYSILLFVHGFNTPFEDALVRSAQLSVDLSRRDVFDVGVPVLFSWPSAGKVSLDDYAGDRDRSLAAAPYLEEFLDLLITEPDIDRINIVAHSMGNRVLTQALEDYAADYLDRHGNDDIEFRIILVAADVDREIFDAATGILDNLEANITIYTSDADRALQVSSIVNKKMRLGDTDGDKPYIRSHGFYETVDATGVATELFGLGHNYYSDNPFILGDMLCAMAEANPESRALERLRYASTPDGPEYFRVTPAVEPADADCSLFRDAFPLTSVSQAPKEDTRDRRFEPTYSPPPPAEETTEDAPAPRELAIPAAPPLDLVLMVEDRDAFDPAAYDAQLMPALNRPGIASITIRAHTDTVGSDEENFARTQAWAEALRAYIVNATGLDPSQVGIEGRGESEPVIGTDDETDEPRNRRIEMTITFE